MKISERMHVASRQPEWIGNCGVMWRNWMKFLPLIVGLHAAIGSGYADLIDEAGEVELAKQQTLRELNSDEKIEGIRIRGGVEISTKQEAGIPNEILLKNPFQRPLTIHLRNGDLATGGGRQLDFEFYDDVLAEWRSLGYLLTGSFAVTLKEELEAGKTRKFRISDVLIRSLKNAISFHAASDSIHCRVVFVSGEYVLMSGEFVVTISASDQEE